MLDEIARELRKGRRLLIGTTNLETQRAMIWDIGAIAESGDPKALELVRNVILASASIPGAFPPAYITVTAGGKTYNEMHVDGGVTRQTFLYPLRYSPSSHRQGDRLEDRADPLHHPQQQDFTGICGRESDPGERYG